MLSSSLASRGTPMLGIRLGSCFLDKISMWLGHRSPSISIVVEILEKVLSYQKATLTKSHT